MSSEHMMNIFTLIHDFNKPLPISRPVRLLRGESSRYRYLKLRVRPSVNPQQLQGGASHHQDGGGGETLHVTLRGSRWVAKTFRLLDDSGK